MEIRIKLYRQDSRVVFKKAVKQHQAVGIIVLPYLVRLRLASQPLLPYMESRFMGSPNGGSRPEE